MAGFSSPLKEVSKVGSIPGPNKCSHRFQFDWGRGSVIAEEAKVMKKTCTCFWQETQGQDLVEYALATGMVAVAAVAAMPTLSAGINNVYAKISSIISAQVN